MSPLAASLLAGNLVCDATGQLVFKAAASATDTARGPHLLAVLRSGWTWIGLMAYVGEFAMWLAFLSLEPLGKAVLLSTVNILLVMLAGRLFFDEPLTLRRSGAALLIMGGVALIGLD